MKTLLSKLGLAETATEAEALATLINHLEFRSKVEALSGKSGDEALGALAAWKTGVVELAAKLSALEEKSRDTELTRLIDGAVSEGRATPAQKDSLIAMGKLSPEALKGFLAASPKLHKEASKEPSEGGTVVALTAEDRKVAKAMGILEADFAKAKARQAASL